MRLEVLKYGISAKQVYAMHRGEVSCLLITDNARALLDALG